jgi:hypothetical protein
MKHLLLSFALSLLFILGCTKTENIVQPAPEPELNYTEYVATVSQFGTNVPVSKVIHSSLKDSLTYFYSSVGIYFIESKDSIFVKGKTYLSSGGLGNSINCKIVFVWSTSTRLILSTSNMVDELRNSCLIDAPILIRIYN